MNVSHEFVDFWKAVPLWRLIGCVRGPRLETLVSFSIFAVIETKTTRFSVGIFLPDACRNILNVVSCKKNKQKRVIHI